MPHTIRYNPETNIVEVNAQGDIYLDDIKEMYSEAMQIAKDKNTYLFFSDYSNAEIRLSTLEIYELPQTFADIATAVGFNPYNLKRAIIPSQRLDDFLFFETVSANRGQSLAKLFQDSEEAMDWLSEK